MKGEVIVETNDDFATVVGDHIRALRQQRGWTQADLATAAGLSTNYVARLERGELGASLFVASRIAEALDTTLDRLASSRPAQQRTTTRRRTA